MIVIGALGALLLLLVRRRLRTVRREAGGSQLRLAVPYPADVVDHRDPRNGKRADGGF